MRPRVPQFVDGPGSDAAPPRRGRFYLPALDGLRFFAFLLVLISHMHAVAGLFWSGSVVDILAIRVNEFGWMGVDLFLVLSAFLITSLLLIEYDETGDISIGAFYMRRCLRIFPLYYAYLLFALLVYPFITPLLGNSLNPAVLRYQALPFALFLGNYSYWYFQGFLVFSIAHLWTISLEEQFYLIMPIAVRALCKSPLRTLVMVCLLLEIVALAFRYYAICNVPYPFVWVITICRLDPLIAGACAAALVHNAKRVTLPAPILIGLALALTVLVTSYPQVGQSLHTVWQLLAVALAATCLVAAAVRSSAMNILFGNIVMRYLGRISFGLYVYHEICLAEVTRALAGSMLDHPTRHWTVVLLATILADIAVSSTSYFLLERSFLLLKRRFELVVSRPA